MQDLVNTTAVNYWLKSKLERIETTIQELQSGKTVSRENRFVGLSNQGATCYLNSAVQTLFMTPEFRRNIYKWRYDPELHGDKEACIPYQLQKLFAELQVSRKDHVETRELTRSFGWSSAQSFEQQDVQEFLRVLFDTIEESFKLAGDSFEPINDLYQGQMTSYVRCDECKHENCRDDTFLDISLPIKNEFGTGVVNSSLEMALENYLKPDRLTDDNQYHCEKCAKKVDADKGLKLSKCPRIISFSLNRFTLDYNTFTRVKVGDRVSFPLTLNLNDYMSGYEGIKNKLYDQRVAWAQKNDAQTTQRNVAAEQKKQEYLERRHQKPEETGEEAKPFKDDYQITDKVESKPVVITRGVAEHPLMAGSSLADGPQNAQGAQGEADADHYLYTYLDQDGQAQIGELQSPALAKELSGQYQGVTDVWETDARQDEALLGSSGTRGEQQEAPVLQRVLDDLVGGGDEDAPEDKKQGSPSGLTQDPYESSQANEDNNKPGLQKRDKALWSWSGSSEFELLNLKNASAAAGEQGQIYDGYAPVQNHSVDSNKMPSLERQPSQDDGLAAALEQIRQREELESLQKPQAEEVKEYLAQGEHVYQLFSVLIHSGGAAGGHYYAYIKSLEDEQWWHFNDCTVTHMSADSFAEELQRIFGDSGPTEYFSSTTAYMLFYRKYEAKEGSEPKEETEQDQKQSAEAKATETTVSDELIPDYLMAELAKEKEGLIDEQLQKKNELLKLPLRVYEPGERDSNVLVVGDQLSTLGQLIEEIKRRGLGVETETPLSSIESADIRLRKYRPKLKVMEDVYGDHEVQLIDYGFGNNADLKVEVRGADGKFEDYNANLRVYRVWTWDSYVKHREAADGVKYEIADENGNDDLVVQTEVTENVLAFDSLEIDQLQCDFTMDADFQETTFADLEKEISEKTGIPADELALLRRVEPQGKSGSARVDRINNSATRPKKLCESYHSLPNNEIIFVEKTRKEPESSEMYGGALPSSSGSLGRLNWYKAIKAEDSLLKINFTVKDFPVATAAAGAIVKAELPLRLHKQTKFGRLKEIIAEKLTEMCNKEIDATDFIVKRKNMMRQYKDPEATLASLSILSGASLMVQEGKDVGEGKFSFRIFFIKLNEQLEKTADQIDDTEEAKHEKLVEKTELGRVTVEAGCDLQVFKDQIFRELVLPRADELGIHCSEQMRLRNPKGSYVEFEYHGPGEIIRLKTQEEIAQMQAYMLNYSQSLDSMVVYDNKQFYIQKADHEQMRYQTTEGSQYTALVAEFNGDTWQLGPLREVQFERYLRCSFLAEFLQANLYPHIELDDMLGCRLKLERPFTRSDLALKAWHKLKFEYMAIGQSVLQVSDDSSLIVIRDGKIPIRDLTLEDDGELIGKYATQSYLDFILKKTAATAGNDQPAAEPDGVAQHSSLQDFGDGQALYGTPSSAPDSGPILGPVMGPVQGPRFGPGLGYSGRAPEKGVSIKIQGKKKET